MTELALYHSPGACSRVPLVLLAKAQANYELRIVRTGAGENRAPAFLQVNPKGKVPVLVRNGEALTENVAIVSFLAQQFPQARLMPHPIDGWGYGQALSWLAWGATTLQPLVGRIRSPQRIAEGEQAQASVQAMGVAELQRSLQLADQRLSARRWLAGDDWMAPDVYLFWVVTRGIENGIDLGKLPSLAAHFQRLQQEPVLVQALAREASAVAALPSAPH
jgi:glutathione S-transferase